MRKKILFQTAVIITVFMIVALVIIEAAISHSSILLFTTAKEELLSRDHPGDCVFDQFDDITMLCFRYDGAQDQG